MKKSIIKIKNLSKCFGKQKVLNNLSLDIEKNTMTSIIGASGSGKTTLLNLIGTLEKPDEGYIEVDGSDITCFDKRTVC